MLSSAPYILTLSYGPQYPKLDHKSAPIILVFLPPLALPKPPWRSHYWSARCAPRWWQGGWCMYGMCRSTPGPPGSRLLLRGGGSRGSKQACTLISTAVVLLCTGNSPRHLDRRSKAARETSQSGAALSPSPPRQNYLEAADICTLEAKVAVADTSD